MLVVLRGPSGSGKSTIARRLQERLERPTAVLGLDQFRRVIYREKLGADGQHIDLLASAAEHALLRGHHVILEGIFDARRYSEMLASVAAHATDARFYAFDLTFDETLERHATRPQAATFGADEMREWYLGWQPLAFVTERRIAQHESTEGIVERILTNQ